MKATITKQTGGYWKWRIGHASGSAKTQQGAIKAAKKHADECRLWEKLNSQSIEVEV